MTFLDLQNKFAKKHLDTRATWESGGADNLEALNDGYKEVFNKAIQDRTVQGVLKSAKTLITITDNEGDMPADFLQPVNVYFKGASNYYDEIDTDTFHYRFQLTSSGYKIIFDETPTFPVYIEYIEKIVDLVDDTDIPVLPTEFDSDIVNYAIVEYFRNQRDWTNVGNSLQYAEGKILETLEQFWME